MEDDVIAKQLNVNGIVQGVGFRPFVYQLANHFELAGEVANTATGVFIHIEGSPENIDSFCNNLTEQPPPLAQITEVSSRSEPVKEFRAFSIVKSKTTARRSTLISPDMSICEDCLTELFNPSDHRYHYPFINCTNCGPRYTIINDIPYDRPKTSMKPFTMCDRCQAEYDDPNSRRYHAQPNACGDCGPRVILYDCQRQKIDAPDPIRQTAELLKKGHILAIKGLGGYHLAVDAENPVAVEKLRKRKHREEKPLALMSLDLEAVSTYAFIEPDEKALLLSSRRPIVLLTKKETHSIAEAVSSRNRYFGAMLPYTPLHYLLLSQGFKALVMTSGNISEEPIAIDNEDAFDRLKDIADFFLVHDRDIYLRSDDSIVKQTAGEIRFIRRSRGYVPTPVFLHKRVPSVLACGAELKNTICLTKEKNAFLSQHIGDLENLPTYDFFKLTIEHLKRILDINPDIIATDLHPDYMSTRYAETQSGLNKVEVQHHHAHIVSCMAENRIDGPVIGLSFDGTGYGSDGCVWGGEILIAEADHFTRAAHLAYVPMPGSAAAIKEPWRMAISYLYNAYGENFLNLELPFLSGIGEKKIHIIAEMISKRINSPDTSSLGRFFDGIASLAGIRNRVFFEGQAAMELEMMANMECKDTYDMGWTEEKLLKIQPGSIVKGVVDDLKANVHPSIISGKFHLTLIRLFTELCEKIKKEQGLNRVAMSGGVFQNSILLTGLDRSLKEKGFEVFTHRVVPTNDGGISLGQAVAAAAMVDR